ncbi:MAG: DUF2232 domain-containing protein [Candidatus Methylomirabilales bacterium]
MSGTRGLAAGAEGVLVTLVAVGLFASASLFPVLGVALSLLAPLPLVVLGLRRGRLPLLLVLGAAALALAVPLSPRHGLVFLLEFGVPALLLAEGLRRGARSEVVVVAVAAALALGGLAVLVVSGEEWGQPLRAVQQHVRDLLAEMEGFTARLGVPGEAGEAVPVAKLRSFLLTAFPGLFFTGSLLSAAGYLLVLQAGLRRWPARLGGLAAAAFRWELPEILVWAFIGSGVLYLTGLPWLYEIGVNGLIVLVGLYFLQGLSIAVFLFDRFKLPKFLATLSVVLLVFQPFFTLLVAGLGLFDVWFAFRRLSLPKNSRGAT